MSAHRFAAACGLVLGCWVSVAHAQQPAETTRATHEIELEDVLGAATVNATERRPPIDATVHSMLASARSRLFTGLDAMLLVPFTTGFLREGRESGAHPTIFGNIGAAVDKDWHLTRDLRVEAELLVTVPTAPGDPASEDHEEERRATMNSLSAAVRGLEDDELYLSRRWSLVPRVDAFIDLARVHLSLFAKLPLLFRAGGVAPSAESERVVHRVAVDGVVGAQAVCRIAGEMEHEDALFAFAAGGRAVLDYFFIEPIDEPDERELARSQLVLESIMQVRYGAVRGRFGVVLPVGGRLHDGHETVHAFRFAIGVVR